MDREARWVESVPLVDEKGHSPSSVDGEEDQIPQRRPQPWFRRNWKTVALNSVTTTLSLIALVFYFQEHDRRCNINRPHSQIYTPAKDYLRYQTIQMDTSGRHLNKYMNVHRTPEVDEAWHELMEYNNVRLTEQELLQMNQSSVSLGDGGYLAMPSVYHELHCLKQIRWAYHRNEYMDRWSERDLIDLDAHVEHCIDILRQSVMCRADTSMITYWWTDVSRVPETDFFGYHQCVDWDHLMLWFKERYVNIYEPGVLNHPKYGQTYPGGHRKVEDDQGRVPETLPFVRYTGPQRL